jgi:hypothetical protein
VASVTRRRARENRLPQTRGHSTATTPTDRRVPAVPCSALLPSLPTTRLTFGREVRSQLL